MKSMKLFAAFFVFALAGFGCAEDRGSTQDSVERPQVPEDVQPPGLGSARLTQAQYTRVVQDVFGDAIVVPARLEPDSRNNGFLQVGATASSVSPRGIEQYESAAFEIAQQVLRDEEIRGQVVGCEPEDSSAYDDSCTREVVQDVGQSLYRRPLSDDEVDAISKLVEDATLVLDDFWHGLEFGLAALLQSPHFLYRVEPIGDSNVRNLDDFEMATRLSFFLWNTTPDKEMLAAAAAGELTDPERLSERVWLMLEDPRARDGLRAFFTDLYELDKLDGLSKAPELFPHISENFGPSAREETLRLIESIVFEERSDFRDILTTRKTFLNPKLASVYNVRAPAREGFAEHIYPEDHPRVGLLGHASFLSLWAHPVATSATLRGMFVQTKLLCRPVPPPPAGVDTSIPEPSGDTPTLRDRIKEHLEDPGCASCHNITDPIGLSFEHFDGIGRWRPDDDGAEIDTSGTFSGQEFETMEELTHILRNDERLGPCLANKMWTYATGKHSGDADEATLEYLAAVFEASRYDVLEVMHALATNPAFGKVADRGENP